MRAIFIIFLCIFLVIGLNYLISEEPLNVLIEHQLNARLENNILKIELHKGKDNDISRDIHWILTILEPHYAGNDIIFYTLNGTYMIDRQTLKKYYEVQIMDRSGVIRLDEMRVK